MGGSGGSGGGGGGGCRGGIGGGGEALMVVGRGCGWCEGEGCEGGGCEGCIAWWMWWWCLGAITVMMRCFGGLQQQAQLQGQVEGMMDLSGGRLMVDVLGRELQPCQLCECWLTLS